jgi:hypothetical protein
VDVVTQTVPRGWWGMIRNGLSAGVCFMTGGLINFNVAPVARSTTSTVTQTTVSVSHTVVRHAAHNRVVVLFVVPVAASIGLVYYWWKKRSR